VEGCKQCFNVNRFDHLCDVDGCEELATCGSPTDVAYRFTCHAHVPAVTR
jgi:hypothetical protein